MKVINIAGHSVELTALLEAAREEDLVLQMDGGTEFLLIVVGRF